MDGEIDIMRFFSVGLCSMIAFSALLYAEEPVSQSVEVATVVKTLDYPDVENGSLVDSSGLRQTESVSLNVYDSTEMKIPLDSFLSVKKYLMGVMIDFGFSSVYDENDVEGRFDPSTDKVTKKKAFSGVYGFNLGLGLVGQFNIHSFLSVVSEAKITFRDYIRESDYYCYEGEDSCEPMDESYKMFAFDIPILLRLYAGRMVFFEAGASLNLKMHGWRKLSFDDYKTTIRYESDDEDDRIEVHTVKKETYSEDLGSWDCETVGSSLIFGIGHAEASKSLLAVFGARLIVDYTNLEKKDVFVISEKDGTYRKSSSAKGWSLNLYFQLMPFGI